MKSFAMEFGLKVEVAKYLIEHPEIFEIIEFAGKPSSGLTPEQLSEVKRNELILEIYESLVPQLSVPQIKEALEYSLKHNYVELSCLLYN